jgi:hypothetical protein
LWIVTMNILPGDFAGAHASARIPVSRALLNRLVADALADTKAPVRSVDIQPRGGDQFDAVVTVSWPFVPALTVSFRIEQQATFPDSPVLVLRWSFLGAVGALASRLVSSFDRLPDGVRVDGERLLLNLPLLAARSPLAPMLGYLTSLELHTVEDRALVDVELAIPE